MARNARRTEILKLYNNLSHGVRIAIKSNSKSVECLQSYPFSSRVWRIVNENGDEIYAFAGTDDYMETAVKLFAYKSVSDFKKYIYDYVIMYKISF